MMTACDLDELRHQNKLEAEHASGAHNSLVEGCPRCAEDAEDDEREARESH